MTRISNGAKAALVGLCVLSLAAVIPSAADAFGTINSGGQNAEHGRITRKALECSPGSEPGSCFASRTLDSLAGKSGEFGAIGAPDRGRGMLTSYAHCSGGDYLDVEGYPRSREEAQATIAECRSYMVDNLAHAVEDAAKLLDDEGNIRSRQASMRFGCTYVGTRHGRAKCNILAHLGRILHASQDFYAHSNWVDTPDASRDIGALNPPGLGQRGMSPWLDLRQAEAPFPEGLISGCFDNISFLDEERGCLYGEDGAHRIRHANINKDRGLIGEQIGVGTTERGALHDNFRHAVEAAIEDSADKWATYREALITTYGEERAGTMICVLTSDNPRKECSGDQA